MSLTGADFVAWDAAKNKFSDTPYFRARFNSLKEANAFISKPVAPEITLLVTELTAYFGHIGMHAVCGDCFAGRKLPPIEGSSYYRTWGHHGSHGNGPGVGCCAPCGLQGHNGCLSKPLGCAMWMCGYTAIRFTEAHELLSKIREKLGNARFEKSVYAFFSDARAETVDDATRKRLLLAVAMLRKARGVRKGLK